MTFSEIKKAFQHHKDVKTIIPKRATKGSAGYDYYLKEDITLKPGQTVITFTDVKCKLAIDEVLKNHIRSSVGTKLHIQLANGTGVIDSDYWGNDDNDGNIGIALNNYGTETINFYKGDRIAQGVIQPCIIRDNPDDESDAERQGGFGSTSK